jgi:micrococcal nuclease
VDGETVTLRRPSTGPEHDRYGRTLAEVFVGGRSVNEMLVHDGAAEWYEEFAGEDAELAGRLRSAESGAKIARKGLWSACASPAPVAATAAFRASCCCVQRELRSRLCR